MRARNGGIGSHGITPPTGPVRAGGDVEAAHRRRLARSGCVRKTAVRVARGGCARGKQEAGHQAKRNSGSDRRGRDGGGIIAWRGHRSSSFAPPVHRRLHRRLGRARTSLGAASGIARESVRSGLSVQTPSSTAGSVATRRGCDPDAWRSFALPAPTRSASAMRASRLSRISISRSRWDGSGRRSEPLTHASLNYQALSDAFSLLPHSGTGSWQQMRGFEGHRRLGSPWLKSQ